MKDDVNVLMTNRTSVPTQHCSARMNVLTALFTFKHKGKTVLQATRALTDDDNWCVEHGDVLSEDEADRIFFGYLAAFKAVGVGITYLAR